MTTMLARRARPTLAAADADAIAARAKTALLAELETWPKPGLVSHVDAGSHRDMDAKTFRASAAAIAPFYGVLARAGADGAPMDRLRAIGRAAEGAMMAATAGVNTHRGAIFGLGLLCAATGAALREAAMPVSAKTLAGIVRRRWAPSILDGPIPLDSHGSAALLRFGAGGAREQAATGFPHAVDVGLPALRLGRTLAPGDGEAARVQAFFALLACLPDTNLLHRGGSAGLLHAQASAATFLADGGVGQRGWRRRAVSVHADFVARNLSPGGCADLLAMTLFLDGLETAE